MRGGHRRRRGRVRPSGRHGRARVGEGGRLGRRRSRRRSSSGQAPDAAAARRRTGIERDAAKPLPATASTRREIYRERADGVVTISRSSGQHGRRERRAAQGSGFVVSRRRLHPHQLARGHHRGRGEPSERRAGPHGLRPVPRRRAGPGEDRRLGRLRRRRRPQGDPDDHEVTAGAARRLGAGGRRRARCGDRQPVRTGELALRRRRRGDGALDRLAHLESTTWSTRSRRMRRSIAATPGGPISTRAAASIGINAQIRSESGNGRGRRVRRADQLGGALDGAADRDGQGALRLARRDHADCDAHARRALRLRARTTAPRFSRSSTAARPTERGSQAAQDEEDFEGHPLPRRRRSDRRGRRNGRYDRPRTLSAPSPNSLPGRDDRLTILRGYERIDVKAIVLGERPANPPAQLAR